MLLKTLQNLAFFAAASCLLSCSDSDSGGDGTPAPVAPTNLAVTAVVAGQDDAHPNGDGTGLVSFQASANDALTYSFTFPGGETVNSENGNLERLFTQSGTNTYPITVKAFGTGNTSVTLNTSVTVFYEPQLVWQDEFDTGSAPNPAKWTAEFGAGGWGNGEAQYYTDDPSNLKVEDGLLKITAKKENFSGSAYTSARIKSENKFEFTYGRVEVRAKLPSGGGTWPAIWMLGENYGSATWPACGEIDIMEHVGNSQNQIHATLHYPGHSGGNGNGAATTVPTASSAFHIYSCEWSTQAIKFYVDGNLYHTVFNNAGIPFNHDFFLILNFAMGGGFGGNIDPAFTQATFEIDYVRVYQ